MILVGRAAIALPTIARATSAENSCLGWMHGFRLARVNMQFRRPGTPFANAVGPQVRSYRRFESAQSVAALGSYRADAAAATGVGGLISFGCIERETASSYVIQLFCTSMFSHVSSVHMPSLRPDAKMLRT